MTKTDKFLLKLEEVIMIIYGIIGICFIILTFPIWIFFTPIYFFMKLEERCEKIKEEQRRNLLKTQAEESAKIQYHYYMMLLEQIAIRMVALAKEHKKPCEQYRQQATNEIINEMGDVRLKRHLDKFPGHFYEWFYSMVHYK